MSLENKEKQEEQQQTNQTATETQQDNGLPKTQEELDALIAKRIARDRKTRAGQQQEQTKIVCFIFFCSIYSENCI